MQASASGPTISPSASAEGLFACLDSLHARRMDELELRIAALETAFIWAFSLTDDGPAVAATVKDRIAMLETSLKDDLGRTAGGPEAAADAAKTLRAQSDTASWGDRNVMLAAARLLEDSARRWISPFG